MIRSIFISAFVLGAFVVSAQSEVVGTISHLPSSAAVSAMKTTDTLSLPFSEDFTARGDRPLPARWTDAKVLVNNQFGVNPVTRGVATFDGMNEGGRAYDINISNSDTLADVLTSRYLNLSAAPSPYLSFIYQEGGWGEFPESGDSLVVDFWNVDSARWERVWSVEGGIHTDTSWNWAMISANEAKWKKRGFRFRIGTYGALNGGFDVWNIDYINLEGNRTASDTIIEDPAMTRPHPLLTNNYTKVPYFHMSTVNYKTSLTLRYRRNGPVPTGGWQLNLGKYRLYQDGVEVDSRLNPPVISTDPHNVELSFNVPVPAGNIVPKNSETTISMTSWYDGENVPFLQNDTLIMQQTFDNSYAYDDGTAERVYGLTQANSTLLFEFQPLTADDLIGLRIHFGETRDDISNDEFQIVVYSYNSGVPGSIIYKSDSLYKPQYMPGANQFGIYALDDTINISGTVFIGLIQLSNTPLTVGLDRNTTGLTNIVYGDGANWYGSNERGTLMIRPYYRTQPSDISVEESVEPSFNLRVYPNPSQGLFVVDFDGPSATGLLMDVSGRVVWSDEVVPGQTIQPFGLSTGTYLFQLRGERGVQTERLIIQNR